MNPSTEKMLMQEIPRIRELLERIAPKIPGEDVEMLKPGVTVTRNGRFTLNGKLIRKSEAYV